MKSAQNKIVKKILQEANAEWVRGRVDKNKQKVTVTHGNMKEAFKEAFEKLKKDVKRLQEENFTDTDYKAIAHAAMSALDRHLQKERTLSSFSKNETSGSGDTRKVVFYQPRTVASPFNNLKKAGVDEINARLKLLGKRKLTTQQGARVKAGVERHHKETTVGQAQLAIATNILSRSKFFGREFMKTEEMKSIFDKFGDVTATYNVIRGRGGKLKDVKNTKEIKLDLKKASTNFAGSESTDWEHVKPALEEAIASWAEKQDWANTKGSDSDVDIAKKIALYNTVRALVAAGGIYKGRLEIPRSKDSRAKATGKGKASPGVSTRKASVGAAGAAPRRERSSQLLNLVALINAKLPETVAKNMGPPGLTNRTGRFASSARVTDVMATAQGFPSIGYTYERDPYQVFELGQGRPPWASQERDPRRLIDASIREIAATMIQGRFFTRRT